MTACDRCGRTAEGFAMIGDRRLCHPDYGRDATCYERAQWEAPKRGLTVELIDLDEVDA